MDYSPLTVSRRLGVLVVALLAWLGSVTPPAIAAASQVPAALVSIYIGAGYNQPINYTAAERAPLAQQPKLRVAVDRRSGGSLTRPGTVTTWAYTPHDRLSSPALIELVAADTRRFAAIVAPDLRVPTGAHVAAEAAAEAPALSISQKIGGQMGPRGWSQELMEETVASPAARHPVWDFTSGTKQAATAYARSDGSYVVVNDSTGAVVQVSDINNAGWKPVWNDPRFQR